MSNSSYTQDWEEECSTATSSFSQLSVMRINENMAGLTLARRQGSAWHLAIIEKSCQLMHLALCIIRCQEPPTTSQMCITNSTPFIRIVLGPYFVLLCPWPSELQTSGHGPSFYVPQGLGYLLFPLLYTDPSLRPHFVASSFYNLF